MRNIADKIDMNVLDEIIKLAESAMSKGVTKGKPQISVTEVSLGKKPMENEMGKENEGDQTDKKEDLSEYGTENPSPEMEAKDEMSDMSEQDMMDLMEEYKKKRG